MRLHLAARIGQEKNEDKGLDRAVNMREAFNSPFWPFVLTSTSIGQEGLDFHPYCHAVGHWNLPTNPVDLEQREGRVHRYKGHAVRKNVASVYGQDQSVAISGEPWTAAFDQAIHDRPADASDLVPYWVHPIGDGAQIERHTFPMPLSRDVQRFNDLVRSLASYRLALGQPRQEDLLAFMSQWYPADELSDLVDRLRLDLSPRHSCRRKSCALLRGRCRARS